MLLGARFHTWGGDTDAATGGGGGSSQGDWRKQRVESGCTRFGVEGVTQQGRWARGIGAVLGPIVPAQQIYGARACSAGPNTSGPSAARGMRRACEKAESGCCGSGSPSVLLPSLGEEETLGQMLQGGAVPSRPGTCRRARGPRNLAFHHVI